MSDADVPSSSAPPRRTWKKRFKLFRRRVREPFLRMGTEVLSRFAGLLPLRSLPRLAAVCGALIRCWPPARRLVRTNLAIAFPEKSGAERERLAVAAVRNLILTFLEFFWFARHPERLKGAVDMDNPEAQELLAACLSGKGGIFVTPHLGNWELCGQIFAAHGVRLHAVAAKIKSAFLSDVMTRARTYHGIIIVPEQGAVRGMLQAFRNGDPVGILMDQNTSPKHGGVPVPFFGLPAYATRAPASLARRLNQPVRFGALVRENGRFTVRSVPFPRTAGEFASDEELTAALMAANEALIRRYPEQYLWLYARWRTIPAGADAAAFPYYAEPLR